MSADAEMPKTGWHARQLVLDLSRAPSYDPDEYLVSPSNADAHALIERWPDWPGRALLIVGPPGSGKSHLGAIWAARARACVTRAGMPCLSGAESGPMIVLVEDADRACYPEAALFHLLNLVEETDGFLVITARTPPDLWGVRTPDLLSRLRRAPAVAIGRPDPALLGAVLVKLFADRQIRIEADVVAYAARHCEQSLEAISRFVAAVDEAALAAGRRITRPLAARTIAGMRDEDTDGDDTRKPALDP